MADANIHVKIKGDSSSAEQAIDRVGSKLENALGEKMGGIAKKALEKMPMAAAAAGVALVAQEVAQLAGNSLSPVSILLTTVLRRRPKSWTRSMRQHSGLEVGTSKWLTA